MTKRATLEELKEFANKVREAGGANPIDALIPAVPQDSEQCLIAKNLNFNCSVEPGGSHNGWPNDEWVMVLPDEAIRDSIASKLGLKPVGHYGVLLPSEIGAVAQAFDDALEDLGNLDCELDCGGVAGLGDFAILREMLPYIEASTIEAYELAGEHITNDGKLIL